MFNKFYIKVSILILGLLIVFTVVFVNFDSVSQTSNLSSNQNTDNLNEQIKREADSTKALDYFSVFKFVNNFNPSK